MKPLLACLFATAAAGFLTASAAAQTISTYPQNYGQNYGGRVQQSPYGTTGYRSGLGTQQNSNYWYLQQQRSSYALSPYVFTPPTRNVGPAYPYTDEQYGQILRSTLDTPAAGADVPPRRKGSLLDATTPTLGAVYGTAEARILDVADRGVLVADTQEEVRLRGIRIPSQQSSDDVTRFYAREALRILREVTANEPVMILFDDPVRDAGGNLLATVYLRDGTNVNKLMLEHGFAQLAPDDFPPDESPEDLALSQETARSAKLGLWSRR